MSLNTSQIVSAPVDEVYAWHGRAGAIVRLTPPWLPVQIAQEADSLETGRALLRFPGGLTWAAQHTAADPPFGFVDELVSSLPFRWRHTHRFSPVGPDTARVTDQVDTPVPSRLLRQMFAYRHAQLADDLEVQHRMAALALGAGDELTVAMTGASGLIGTALAALLTTGGHRVIRLVRGQPHGANERQWQPDDPDPRLLDGVDAVIHLAGEPISGRFTNAHRRAIWDSRIGPTRRLAELMAARRDGPRVLAAASAIGYYGPDRGDEELSEGSSRGSGLLADLVGAWEEATAPARDAGVRVVNVRTGIVQSPRGGALRLLRLLFETGLGGPLAGGDQWMAWIDVDDLADVYYRAVLDSDLSGPVNGVAPNPVRNREYTAVLARVLRRPAFIPVPGLGPRVLLGRDGARELAEASQRVRPDRLEAAGHTFRRPSLEDCLRHQLGRRHLER
jgi:hypothetical protein